MKYIRQFLLLLLAYMGFSGSLFAQIGGFKHLTMEEGMLSELRVVITEDRQGRIWLGSDEGINIFDGVELGSLSLPDHSGLLNNKINQIFCSSDGTIWINTPCGVQYKPEQETRFRTLVYNSDTLIGARFFQHAPDRGIFATTVNACYHITPDHKVTRMTWLDSIFQRLKAPLTFYHFGDNLYCWAFQKAIVIGDVKTHRILKTIPYREAWALCKVSDSTLLAGSFAIDSLYLINIHSAQKTYINDWTTTDGKRIGGYAGSIFPVGENKYAVGCRYYGVYILDVSHKSAEHLVHDPTDPTSLKSNFCRRLYVTRSGILFVQTRGISYKSLELPQFKREMGLVDKNGEKYEDGFNDFIEDDKGRMWIATNSYLARWDRITGAASFYPFYREQDGKQQFKTIRTVAIDRLGRVWVGTFGGGVGMLLPNGKFKIIERNISDSGRSYPGHEIHAINTDRAGNFFICANSGFSYFNPLTGVVQTFRNHPKLKKIARHTTYYALEDNSGRWWIAQQTGLSCYDPGIDSLRIVDLGNTFYEKEILSLAQDNKGTIYAGSTMGLFLVNPNTFEVAQHLTKQTGLTSDYVAGLLSDNTGNMWILGNRGLSRYNPLTQKLESFTSKDGIEQSNHTLCNYYLARNGEMFIGSARGFNHFFPQRIQLNNDSLPVCITSMELADTIISMPGNQPFHLQYFQNNISFSYLSVDYNLAPYIRYRYLLKGFDTGFVTAGKIRKARYTNLPPGKYSFVVQASANGQDWYEAKQSVTLTIDRALWKRNWFIAGLFALLFTGIYLLFRFRVRRVKTNARQRADYEIRLNEMENNLLRTQMTPHFIFNSLNTINAFINSNDKKQANEYISKFSKLIRLILDHSRQKRVTLAEELTALDIYIRIEQIRFSHTFDYTLRLGSDIHIEDIEIPSMMIQPFVENAILHGLLPMQSGGHLTLSLLREGPVLRCEITDNGIGRKLAMMERQALPQKKKSHGLAITLKRIELFNREYGFEGGTEIIDLYDASGKASGTQVIIRLAYVERF